MHPRKHLFLFSLLLAFLSKGQNQELAKKSYTTSWADSEIAIDGKLDDDAWNQVEWGGDFVGFMPEFNVSPTQETQFKVLHDAKFIYVAIRAFDTEPDKIQRRMTRRDGFDGDRVTIMFDSYYDKRTAFSFTACASGVKGEEYVSNNGDNWDSTWDPIWYLKTSIDEKGWVAEFKIPLSQLRFANKESHVWGLQVSRNFFRGQEQNTWQPIDPNAQGWVHLFGELNGIKGIKPQKQLEIQPYLLGSYQKYPKDGENPFRSSGKEYSFNAGLDAKVGITSDITLDVTVNPDFGQVDADPSMVNLSAFQLFFRERRPFFLEGSSLLNFRTSGGPNNLFYSRRIGSSPKGNTLINDDVEYADQPNQTPIIGAFKLTGKNAKGFSWALLESFTNKVDAEVAYEAGSVSDSIGLSTTQKVEPYTNYLVGRVQQDIDGGRTVVGALATHVRRFGNSGNELELLHNDAISAGIDIDHNIGEGRMYGFTFKTMFSRVEGSQGAIFQTQTSNQRNFQRPDNFHKNVDTTRTSLTGTAGTLSFGKRSGNWRWTFGSNYRSPELELDDTGFLRQTDDINNWFWTQYRIPKITRFFRSQRYNLYTELNNDFGGVLTNKGVNFNMNVQFKNFWEFGNGFWIGGSRVSNADLRGGPAIRYPGNVNYWMFVSTNRSKKVSVSVNPWVNFGRENFREAYGLSFNIEARPTDALQLTFSPSLNKNRNDLQWVTQTTMGDDDERYILGRINRETFSASLRANYNITPNLTIEFWGQPFFFFGDYSEFKRVTIPEANQFENRFETFDSQQISFDSESEEYLIDENRNGTTDYSFGKPDFDFFQLQTNMVMRWEYIPGSTLFLVWSSNGTSNDVSRFSDSDATLYSASNISTTQTFLIKYTYRFIL